MRMYLEVVADALIISQRVFVPENPESIMILIHSDILHSPCHCVETVKKNNNVYTCT